MDAGQGDSENAVCSEALRKMCILKISIGTFSQNSTSPTYIQSFYIFSIFPIFLTLFSYIFTECTILSPSRTLPFFLVFPIALISASFKLLFFLTSTGSLSLLSLVFLFPPDLLYFFQTSIFVYKA